MVAWLRSAVRRISAMAASRVASASRVLGAVGAASFVARVAAARWSALERPGCTARASAMAAPSARSSSTSTPASKRIARSRAHPPQRSGSPATAKLQVPSRSAVIQVVNQSWGSATMATRLKPRGGASGTRAPAPGQCQTQVRSGSCPSANARALTRNGRPRVAFAGNSPQSTRGRTCSMTTRLRSPSISPHASRQGRPRNAL